MVGSVPEKGVSLFHENASFKNYLFVDFVRKFSLLSGPSSTVFLSAVLPLTPYFSFSSFRLSFSKEVRDPIALSTSVTTKLKEV